MVESLESYSPSAHLLTQSDHLPTFIAIDIGVLNYYRSAIEGRILLGFPSILSHIRGILPSRRGIGWYSQNMASKKFF